MALAIVSCRALAEPCNGRSLTMVAVGPPSPSPCSPPPPLHPATKNTAAIPSTASIPNRHLFIILSPSQHRHVGLTPCTTPGLPKEIEGPRKISAQARLLSCLLLPVNRRPRLTHTNPL